MNIRKLNIKTNSFAFVLAHLEVSKNIITNIHSNSQKNNKTKKQINSRLFF